MLCSSIGSLAIKPANLPINITFCLAKSCKIPIINTGVLFNISCSDFHVAPTTISFHDIKMRGVKILKPIWLLLHQPYYFSNNIIASINIGPTISFQDLRMRGADLNMKAEINQKQKLHSLNSQNSTDI